MSTLQELQQPIDREICDAMVASAPDTWNRIVLTLTRVASTSAVGDLEHSISSPYGYPPVLPDDSLYDATYRLDELRQRHGGVFRTATCTVELRDDSWSYKAKFSYA